MEKNTIRDKSGEKNYYVQIPRLVWLLSRTPYDLSFWNTIKDVAGESGECRITTKELAILSMMSVGKASECRKFWIETGLLLGEREKEPDERNAIWHLTIPDFWKKNYEEAEKYKKLKNRIQFKKKQQNIEQKTVSPGETVTVSPGEKGSSPHEKGYTPGEKGSSPHETIYLYKEKPLEYPEEEPEEESAPQNGAPKAESKKENSIDVDSIGNTIAETLGKLDSIDSVNELRTDIGNIFAMLADLNDAETLLEIWNRLDLTLYSYAPRDGNVKYLDAVKSRLAEKVTWQNMAAAAVNYSIIRHSKKHGYSYEHNITEFFNRHMDKFAKLHVAWSNFDKARFEQNKNGKGRYEPADRTLEVYESAMRAAKIADSMVTDA